MRRLFLKIFLMYWLATSILGLVLLLAVWSTSESQGPLWLRDVENLLQIHGAAAVETYEREGRPGLAAYLRSAEPDPSMQTFVFDGAGVELTGRMPPPAVFDVANAARHTARAEFGHGLPFMVVARPVEARSGNAYVVAAKFEGGRRGPPLTPGLLIVRGLVVLAAAGFVCYGLAWYLTRRIDRLRAATRSLAKGDLSVRVGGTLGTSRDELADLGHDVDEMAERLEALIASERRLLRDVSHELRSPLTRLVVALELLRQRGDVAATREFDRIELEASRLDDLIGRILMLTRLESSALEVDSSASVDLAALVGEVVSDAGFEAAATGRTVKAVSLQPCNVNGSESLLRSAIDNVVRNAVRYTAEDTAVEVSLRVESGPSIGARTAVVTVRDHGPGVPEGSLEHLFRPFYRVDDGRARQSGGTGLGLAIADRAVRRHGGSTSASNAEGGGLVIEFRLPVSSES